MVKRRRREPTWLSRLVVDAIHNDQLREHGGLPRVRDENALESALARPQQKWHYFERTDVPTLAAAYAYGLVQNHPYRDGNKRIGFLAMITFLGVNGYDFSATDAKSSPRFLPWPMAGFQRMPSPIGFGCTVPSVGDQAA